MKKISGFLSFIITILLCISQVYFTDVLAINDSETNVDENKYAIPKVIDENGQIREIDSKGGLIVTNKNLKVIADPVIVNFNTKVNDVTNYTEESTGISGYTNGDYGADAAFLGYNDDKSKVKFMLSGVIGWVNASEVQCLTYSNIINLNRSYYKVEKKLLKHVIYPDLQKNISSVLTLGNAPDYLVEGEQYYSYDGHYFYRSSNENEFNLMLNDYKNGNRKNSLNRNNPYYNYFQYLPLRSKTNYSATELNTIIEKNTKSTSKMRNLGQVFIDVQEKYGVNALILVAIAANESSWGTSNIAMTKNNLFGLNAIDSNPGQSSNYYSNINDCIKDMAQQYMSKEYLYSANWKYFGGFLGDKASGCNVKYASDPYWGEKAAHFAWLMDRNLSKDAEFYSIGIKDTINTKHTNLNIRKEATTSSTSLYQTGIQSNHAFILKNQTSSFYKIQSDSILNTNRTAIDKGNGEYNFENNYAFVSVNYIDKVINGNGIWLGNIAYILKSDGIDIGIDYESQMPIQFKWQSYNLDTGKWESITDWTSGNWATWKPKKGNYWLHIEAKTSDGKTDSETICFAVDKDYSKITTIDITGLIWTIKSNSIDVGAAYTTNDDNVQFKWQSYNLDTGKWESITDWTSGNWATWKPKKGNYWLHIEAKTSDGKTDSETICFAVGKDY